jgi:tripartite-type tricarboxylate transporter receptor subunit TctC
MTPPHPLCHNGPVRRLSSFLLLLLMAISPATARADPYPSTDVRLVVPFPPKGVTDLTARVVAAHLAQRWRRAVEVVNVTGDGSNTGVVQLLRSPADGATMMMTATGAGTQNPAVDPKTPYRWDEPTIVARVTVSPLVFVVNAASPWTTLKEALEAIAQHPEHHPYGTSGSGGAAILQMARLFAAAHIDRTRVPALPQQGGAGILAALVDGRTSFAAQYLAEMRPLLEAHKIKPLAVSTPARAPQLPGVPTGAEAGVPAFDLVGWTGIEGPPGLPDGVVRAWDEAIRELAADPAFRREADAMSATVAYLGPVEFKAALRTEYETAVRAAVALGMRK